MREELELLKRTSRCLRIKVAFEQRWKEVKGQVLGDLGGRVSQVAGTAAHCPHPTSWHRDSCEAGEDGARLRAGGGEVRAGLDHPGPGDHLGIWLPLQVE